MPASLARHVRGTTDSEWIYALVPSGLRDPFAVPEGEELVDAIVRALAIIRAERERLGIDVSSSANLFFADGTQVAALRYCFDFGRYATGDPARVHEAASAILVASEPLTRDVASWVEVPEFAVLHARLRDGRPAVSLRYVD